MHRFQQLQIDVHVEGHLPPSFQLLLLWRLILVPALIFEFQVCCIGSGVCQSICILMMRSCQVLDAESL